MATATAVKTTKVRLELDEDEAQALSVIFGYISGGDETGRGHMNQIQYALENAGYDYTDSRYYRKTTGSIGFTA